MLVTFPYASYAHIAQPRTDPFDPIRKKKVTPGRVLKAVQNYLSKWHPDAREFWRPGILAPWHPGALAPEIHTFTVPSLAWFLHLHGAMLIIPQYAII